MLNEKDKAFNQGNLDDNCDLNPNKTCDNCCKCLDEPVGDYKVVRIDGMINDPKSEINWDEYLLEDETLKDDDIINDMEYIEDIPELKKEYDEKINKLLGR